MIIVKEINKESKKIKESKEKNVTKIKKMVKKGQTEGTKMLAKYIK